jgi:hypothetical protein
MTARKYPELPLHSNVCRCAGCGEVFGSVGAFDFHRVGRGRSRFCLDNYEMRRKGMAKDAYGRWRRQVDRHHPQATIVPS